MRLIDLIADPMLRLELATPSSQDRLQTAIGAAVATESIDPAAYLTPGTLVLTTGMALNFDDARIWDGYVERLVAAGTAAIAFGEGKPHQQVPHGLIDAADARGLPILLVPPDVPFLRLQNLVLRALSEDEHQASHHAWSIAEECTKLAADGLEFAPLLERVASRIGHALRVVDDEGAVFVSTDRMPGSDRSAGRKSDSAPLLSLPLNIGEDEQWHLHCLDSPRPSTVQSGTPAPVFTPATLRTALTPAAAILGMVLARSLSIGLPRSEKTDALLAALRQTGSHASAEIMTALADLGVDTTTGMRMLSVRARSPIRRHLLTWRLMRILHDHVVVFPVETERTVLLLLAPFSAVRWSASTPTDPPRNGSETAAAASLPAARNGREAQESDTYLDELVEAVNAEAGDSVLVSEAVRHTSALSLFVGLHVDPASPDDDAAEHAVTAPSSHRGSAGVRFVGPPRLSDLSLLVPPAHSTAFAEAVLGPIRGRRDETALLDALAAFVDSPSVARAAARLGVHRNTARSHRRELEDALGMDLASGEDRSICAVALSLMP
ncbi:PucR family transcriptional regulator ligand-binding domain-containing protein [Brevibacterium sp. NPDC059310]|uniref:PucR family transcriptional regulator n=1 Tax=Brevibacterium sp. NPDC059310 TaxID=3346802 RepID=UPI00366E5F73